MSERIGRRDTLDERERAALAALLVAVVADGASVGFLAPLDPQDAAAYWRALPNADTVLLLAERDGAIAGTVQLRLDRRPSQRHRAEVAKLLVHPAHRRLGLGRRLVEAIEAEARRDGRWLLVLDTREGDVAEALYRSLGYLRAGRIPHYARRAEGGFDATVLYYKELSPLPAVPWACTAG